jgi:hypothetical protein
MLEWAPLHAEPQFIPEELRRDFTIMTCIPILGPDIRLEAYSILNDPDTGLRLPGRADQSESRRHIAIPTICRQLSEPAVRCVVTFDQGNHREPGLTAEQQRTAKLQELTRQNIRAFYYVSHAPFLFACSTREDLGIVASLLRGAGIPEGRMEWSE